MDGSKSFTIKDDKRVIEKILFGTEQLTRTDNKIILVNVKFSLNACKNLTKNELDNLSDTVHDVFYLVQSFGRKLKLRDFVNLLEVEDRIQHFDAVTCGIFQIYFYGYLFNFDKTAKYNTKQN